MTFEVRQGDCVELMAAMPAGSVDAVVCDPPYGLEFMGKDWDRLGDVERANRGTQPNRKRPPGESGESAKFQLPAPAFDLSASSQRKMQEWHQAWATEALRVLKPGGHLLAFGGTRTYHRLVCAVEDAGFEIRDTISWLYGSGFPKSLDVGKAIDRANGRRFEDRYELGRHIRDRRLAAGLSQAEVNGWFGYRDGCQHWERQDASGARVPRLADWSTLRDRLGLSDEFLPMVEREEAEREEIGPSPRHGGGVAGAGSSYELPPEPHSLTAPATPEAERWEGWGTALKPAHEPVVVARKPLSGTVAGNVLEHGTGALNVDGCRVGYEEGGNLASNPSLREHIAGGNGGHVIATETERRYSTPEPAGRWPANVVLDEEAARLLDEQTGELQSGSREAGEYGRLGYQGWEPGPMPAVNGDRGGASRFFYVAKASRAERSAGLGKEDGVGLRNLHPT